METINLTDWEPLEPITIGGTGKATYALAPLTRVAIRCTADFWLRKESATSTKKVPFDANVWHFLPGPLLDGATMYIESTVGAVLYMMKA